MTKKSRHDITGQRFGRLVAVERIPGLNSSGQAVYLCRCDCGTEKEIRAGYLRDGRTKSCGCLSAELSSKRAKTHGLSRHPLFPVWHSMMARCFKPHNHAYKDYGARGITVCERWQSVEHFIEDASRLWLPGLTLDRIDNDGNYEPGNVRWTDETAQSRNRRSNVYLTFNGKRQTLFEWADDVGIPRRTLWARIRSYGWSVDKALTTPVFNRGQRSRHTKM